ncbi:MAG: SWIM zinc finger family protein [Phycisphaerales bacterium]|nr:SWIM zinc finger family protein [Phycisphaerales bacterium]
MRFRDYGGWGRWPAYVPVAKRRADAHKEMDKLRKKGQTITPVTIEGRTIARSFWGKGWCDHMESFHDFANRLPRGRTYVRNGSVVHLEISRGKIFAHVAGSSLYKVSIEIDLLPQKRWADIKRACSGQIASLVDLLQGRLSDGVMRQVIDRDTGLFPQPKEFKLNCSCPDWADMCKHVAAVCYGVGARLDHSPELLFLLRGVDHTELMSESSVAAVVNQGAAGAKSKRIAANLSEVFGIDLAPPLSTEENAPLEHFSRGRGVMTCAGSESQSPALPCGAPKRYGRVKNALKNVPKENAPPPSSTPPKKRSPKKTVKKPLPKKSPPPSTVRKSKKS